MSDNLNNLHVKAEEFLNTLFVCLQQKEENENRLSKEKLDLLIEQNRKIINQNNELIGLCKELVSKSMIEPKQLQTLNSEIKSNERSQETVIKDKKNSNDEEKPTVPKEEPPVQPMEKAVEMTEKPVEKNDDSFAENKRAFGDSEATLSDSGRTLDEREKTFDKNETQPVENEPVNESVKEEKHTSSVLEFLHKKVIKDTPSEESSAQDGKPLSINTLTEQINQRPKSIAEQFENKTKSDLLTAIGVSEKFMFINDLFSGNIRDYTSFINTLNEASTKEKSQEIIAQMQSRKKWAKGSLAYTTLESIIEKRFE